MKSSAVVKPSPVGSGFSRIGLRRCCLICLTALSLEIVQAQRAVYAGPPVPFEEVGACPFEGCVYREWIANAPVIARTQRRAGAPAAFAISKGDWVTAITGIVVTSRPGRIQFRRAVEFRSSAGQHQADPGDTLYILTSHGEGHSSVWFRGSFIDDVDVFDLSQDCSRVPNCVASLLEPPESVWWVRIRNDRGVTGWTNETAKFDNKDRLAGPPPDPR